jgi:hypothetical protein
MTKMDGSKATIVAPGFIVEALKAHRRRQADERLALPPDCWQEQDLVFCTEVGQPQSGWSATVPSEESFAGHDVLSASSDDRTKNFRDHGPKISL